MSAKDEIKEILDRWNKVCNGELLSTDMTLDEMIMFRDYITNLEQENSEQLDENLKLSEWLVKKQKRIDKAIEYIKECIDSEDIYEQFLSTGETKEVLNILNGGDSIE